MFGDAQGVYTFQVEAFHSLVRCPQYENHVYLIGQENLQLLEICADKVFVRMKAGIRLTEAVVDEDGSLLEKNKRVIVKPIMC